MVFGMPAGMGTQLSFMLIVGSRRRWLRRWEFRWLYAYGDVSKVHAAKIRKPTRQQRHNTLYTQDDTPQKSPMITSNPTLRHNMQHK